MDLRTITIGFFLLIVTVLHTQSVELPSDNVLSRLRRSESSSGKAACSEFSPCRWGVYGNDAKKRISQHIDNNGCVCGPGRKCVIAEENLSMAAFIYRCVTDLNHITVTTEVSEII